jgi:hypothetical protein
VSEPNTLLLRETGIARLDDGREAVNVGPIVAALGFLTERRGEDRGTDENGAPLPDLLSLAFDVVKSIILGGRHADYFRQVKRDFDAQSESGGHTSLALAKQASAVRRPASDDAPPDDALSEAASELQARLQRLRESAAQLVLELESLEGLEPRRAPQRRKSKSTAKAKAKSKPKPRVRVAKTKKKPAKSRKTR